MAQEGGTVVMGRERTMNEQNWKRWLPGLCAMIAVLCTGGVARAETAITTEVLVGKSQILTFQQPIAKVSVGAEEIADVEVINPTHLLLFGKSVGSTNLIIFDDAGQPTFFDVSVRSAIEPRQILLQVRVAEVDRNALKELGVNFVTIQADGSMIYGGGSFAGQVSSPAVNTGTGISGTSDASGLPALSIADSVSAAIFRFTSHNSSAAIIHALAEQGLLTTLAEPNMVVRSGEKGNFLAGGRYPIPVVQGGGGGIGGAAAVTIQYEDYGVKLNVSPVAYEDGRISLAIDPAEVSALDFANAVTLSGFRVPAITTRTVHTVVDLHENETLILAGLLSNDVERNISKFPILGDIPILGALFRSTRFQKKQTDLMIFITPKFVEPLAPATEVAYPGKGGPTKEELKDFKWMPTISDLINKPK
jgi:Flp pilus assembly secretin CpaC